MGKDGVFGVVHAAVCDSFKSQVEHGRLDLLLIALVCGIDARKGLVHDRGDDFILVEVLSCLGFLEDILGSGVKMVFECNLFCDHELGRWVGTLRRELFLMER